MKRIVSYTLAALLGFGSVSASAQTAEWTGDYFVVIGKSEKQELAVTYGHHLKWNELKAGPNFEGGTFADLAVAPLNPRPNAGRYELLAVGSVKGHAVSVVGHEFNQEPQFVDGLAAIPTMSRAAVAAWARGHYVVLGEGAEVKPWPGREVVVAYGRHGEWKAEAPAAIQGIAFTDLAVATASGSARYTLLGVGMRGEKPVAVVAAERGGRPVFEEVAYALPAMTRPLAVAWTGRSYAVIGESSTDPSEFVILTGFPGKWELQKGFHLDGGALTSVVAVPGATRSGPAYTLLAVGVLKDQAVSLPGREVGGVPVFDVGCAPIPNLKGLEEGAAGAPAFAASAAEAGAMSAPYPNPFAARTAFTLGVAERQHVRVAVYDALGREVAVLYDGVLAAGAHALTLDGGALPSGTYLVRAQGERFAEVRRVTLTR